MKRMVWNGNELVFDDKPKHGVAGIAPDQPDSLGEKIAVTYNAYYTSSNSEYKQCPVCESKRIYKSINGSSILCGTCDNEW